MRASSTADGACDPDGLRARKKRETRRAIHEAALRLVADRGLDGVTAEEIASAATVSARTFFNYYGTKDAAVLGLPPDLPETLGAALLARPGSEDLFTALTTVVCSWFVAIEEDPLRDLRRLVVGRDPRLGAALMGANREIETALVEAAARRADPVEDLRARVTAAAVLASARATYLHVQHGQQTGLGAQGEAQGDADNERGPREDGTAATTPDTHPRRVAEALREAFTLIGDGLAPRPDVSATDPETGTTDAPTA